MTKRFLLTTGVLGVVGGMALFAMSIATSGSDDAQAQQTGTPTTAAGTPTTAAGTPAATGTVAATRTPGAALTPGTTPGTAPTSAATALPSTGTGFGDDSSGSAWLGGLGVLLAVAGGGLAFAGARRRG